MVLDGSTVDIILGCPWLSHSSLVSWNTGEIQKWSKYCQQLLISHPELTILSLCHLHLLHHHWKPWDKQQTSGSWWILGIPGCFSVSSWPQNYHLHLHPLPPLAYSSWGLRQCFDYRALNAQTVHCNASHPLLVTTHIHHSRSVLPGLSQLYSQFIANIRQICTPLSTLLKDQPKSLLWNP